MSEVPLLAIITGMLTISVRLSGLMLFAPFFGSTVIPPRVKAGLVMALTLLLFPTVGRDIGTYTLIEWPLLVFREFLIGAGMGIATNLAFEATQLAGQIVGLQMGYSLVNLIDPQTMVDTTVVSVFYQAIVMLIFLHMNVHYWLLRAIGDSFLYVPPSAGHLSGLFTLAVLNTCGRVFGLGVQIAAPVLAATLVTDIVLGLLSKASSQLPVMLLGPAVKTILGVLVLITTLKYWPDFFHGLFQNTLENGIHVLQQAR